MPMRIMKKIYTYILLVVATLAVGMVACTNNFDESLDGLFPATANGGYKFFFKANVESRARAVFANSTSTNLSWESGDALGVFIHSEEEGDARHVANNMKMSYVGESNQFEGTIFSNPAYRKSTWSIFAYYPYNGSATDRNVYHEERWLVKHASRQTQIDANHSNYDNYAFFSSCDENDKSNDIEWSLGEPQPTVKLKDRTAALRFLIKADEKLPADIKADFEKEHLEEVDVFVTKKSTLEQNDIKKLIDESYGITPLSGHFNFNNKTGEYAPIVGETRNYVEVDFMGRASDETKGEFNFFVHIDSDNETYAWAVVPPFTMQADEVLVAIFNTASHKIVCAYTVNQGKNADGSFTFESNKLYNFKSVASKNNIVGNDPIVHTNNYILGESTTATTTGANNSTITYRYPQSATLTMTVDLPREDKYLAEGAMTYYIRYGFCDFCGANGSVDHNGLDVPYSEDTEAKVSWAHEVEAFKGSYNYGNLSEPTEVLPDATEVVHQGTYRLRFRKLLDDTTFLKEAFNGAYDPVFQAYAVYNDGTTTKTFYGHVVHIDMNPFISDFHSEDYASDVKTPFIINNGQFYLNIPAKYFFNGTAPAPYYWVNTLSSFRLYRCDISSQVNSDGSLKTASLDEAVALCASTTEQLPRLQSITSGYQGYYHDINTNGNGFIRYRKSTGSEISLADDSYDDYNGAYCYVIQAYEKETMALVWIRSEYFRLCEIKAASK